MLQLFNAIGWKPSLNESSLIDAAVRRAGLKDFGDEFWLPQLQRLLRAMEDEARLTPWGRFVCRERMINLLMNRLRAECFFNKHPEILQQELKPVIAICGMQRSGTTMLQRLLAADPHAHCVYTWEALNPAPYLTFETNAATDKRRRVAQARMSERVLRYLDPELFAIHPVDHLAPEEEILLLDISFSSTVPEAMMMLPEYSAWLEQQDQTPAYEYMRKLLLLLQWQKSRQATHWVLKSPHHLEWLDTLIRIFPESRIIHTYRDPLTTLPSLLSMLYHCMKLLSDDVSPIELGKVWSRKTAYILQKALDYRAAHGDARFIDICYADLIQDPARQLERIYLSAGLDFSGFTPHTQHKSSRHRYDVTDFGIRQEEAEALFSEYKDRFARDRA